MEAHSYTNRSISRAFDILRCFEYDREPLTVSKISDMTDLALPTAFRLVRVLEKEGALEQHDSGTYRPSTFLLRLGFAALDSMDLVRLAEPRLRSLSQQTMETVNLGVLDRLRLRYLIRIKNADLVTADIRVGSLLPPVSTSMGKLLLAHLDELSFSHLDYASARGPQAIRTAEALGRELAIIRERGWAIQDEELDHGLRSIAVPIHDGSGSVVSAINIAVPASRWTVDDLVERFLDDLQQCANYISRDMGFRGRIPREHGTRATNDASQIHVASGDNDSPQEVTN